jgi:hypothetical protein
LKTVIILFLGHIFYCYFIPHEAYAQDNLKKEILYLNFENKLINSGNRGVTAEITTLNSITIDCHTARKGNCSQKSTIKNSTDYYAHGAPRSETNTTKISESLYKNGDHFFYLFSIRVSENWELNAPKNSLDILWQFKRFNAGPDMFIGIKNNAIVWRIIEDDQIILANPLPRGKWIDFFFDIKWSNQNDGFINAVITIDGQNPKEYSLKGRNMANAANSKYGTIQWGIYKPVDKNELIDQKKPDFENRTVNHDEIYIYKSID